MIKEILMLIRKFNIERDWDKFHTGENLAKSISIEANELSLRFVTISIFVI